MRYNIVQRMLENVGLILLMLHKYVNEMCSFTEQTMPKGLQSFRNKLTKDCVRDAVLVLSPYFIASHQTTKIPNFKRRRIKLNDNYEKIHNRSKGKSS